MPVATWLVKSEPEAYSIDDLARDKRTMWDGVRNYQARNYLRDMAVGDRLLYYHSNCDVPGVVGLAKVVSTAGAIDTVGWQYRFETPVRVVGEVRDGVLHGDLLVVGAGDPSIGGRGGRDLGAWVDLLRGAGIQSIDGRIIGIDGIRDVAIQGGRIAAVAPDIAAGSAQVLDASREVELFQLAQCRALDIREARHTPQFEQRFGVAALERPDRHR